jgi:hypothetical protein
MFFMNLCIFAVVNLYLLNRNFLKIHILSTALSVWLFGTNYHCKLIR